MGTNDLPKHPDHPSIQNSSDRTLSSGALGGSAARQIGPYRLLQLLGEGGMGEVWLAEQKAPIHRTVALKLIKAGMDTKAVVARFESERQALALMDHPSIARVYDAGSTAEGRPYFVMEYVPGLLITEYSDKHRLTMKERLELFMQVCDGVQHAHQKAIIHRDLKPSNVLVVEQDNKAVPKIIDFGLAKATAQRLTDKTVFTEFGVMMGTPEYMSPEQADLSEQNIDTRTDVYSLGVILYELLVGVLPFEIKHLRAAGLEAILRVIREEEPPKPSTKIRSMGEASNATAEKRREEPRSFARHLQGELDWITMKALEKDRVRRYGTPSELSADISRYLRNEPVVAGPATAGYSIQKYAARHRIALGTSAGLLLLLIGFVVMQAVQLRRTVRERDRADRITDFMTNMFKVSDPSEARGNSITAREVLDKASNDIGAGLSGEPEVQGRLMNTMAEVYGNLGIYSQSESLFKRGIDIEARFIGPQDQATLKSKKELANTLSREGKYHEAELLDRASLASSSRVLGPDHRITLTTKELLGIILLGEGQNAQAEKLLRETLDAQRRVFGAEDTDTLATMDALGALLTSEGQYAEAEQLHNTALETNRRMRGEENPSTVSSMTNLAIALSDDGKFSESEKMNRELLRIQVHVLGPEHPDTLDLMNNLAADLLGEKRYPDAEDLFRQVVDIRRRVLGPDHPRTLESMSNLAMVLGMEMRLRESENLFRETLDARRRVLGPEHPETLQAMGYVATVLSDERRFGEAEKLLRETNEMQRRLLGPDHRDTAVSTYNLAVLMIREGRRNESLNLLRQAVDHGLPPFADLGIEDDPELKPLRDDPRFVSLISDARQRAGLK